MSEPNQGITIAEDQPDVATTIESELLDTLRGAQPQAGNSSFVLSARDSNGRLAGGLTASTSYGWLLIKTLWVAKTARQQGLGCRLMTQAEEKGRDIGCHGAWLDTSSHDALRFYRRLGYEPFGQLANMKGQQPQNHCRWFIKKAL